MPTGIVKILYTHAHTANAYTVAHHKNCQIQNYPVNSSTVAARPGVDSVLLAARPTLGLGCHTWIAASSTQPHPYNHRANMHYHLTLWHCHSQSIPTLETVELPYSHSETLLDYHYQSIPTLRTVELTYTTIALAYTQLSSTNELL